MPGLEPRMAEPESAVLPITPHPNLAWRSNSKELFVVPPTGFEPVVKVLQTSALPLGYAAIYGAENEARTRDPHLGKVVLYH